MVVNRYKFNFKDLNIDKIGFYSFLAGIFFLASAVGISIILLLVSLFISFLKPQNLFKDKWNYPLIFSSFLMLFSTIVHFLTTENNINLGINPELSLIGLINWIPLFLGFWGFQKYLNSPHKRLIASKLLIYGSIPVIFSGILQIFNINGPFELFDGLIVWFQKPLKEVGSLSGLFNNQNYAGLWMALVWPFCLSEFNNPKKSNIKKLILLIICFLFITFIFLTDSRNAILGLTISSAIVLGTANFFWYLPTIFLGFSLVALTVLPIFPNEVKLFMESIIPKRIYTLFPEVGFNNISTYPRINKWISSVKFILENPIFGWGAASFPILYKLKSGEWFGHAHNLPFELAISYGILPALIIFSFYSYLLFLSFKKIILFTKTRDANIGFFLNQKAWLAASFIFLSSHLVDIQYFDARFSTLCWILLAGLRCFLREDLENKVYS